MSAGFSLRGGEESEQNLCFGARFSLCGVHVRVPDFFPLDTLTLRRCGACSYWSHTLLCTGEALFGYLLPGAYILTLRRNKGRVCLLLKLAPGANIDLCCRFGTGACNWSIDRYHYFYNSSDR